MPRRCRFAVRGALTGSGGFQAAVPYALRIWGDLEVARPVKKLTYAAITDPISNL